MGGEVKWISSIGFQTLAKSWVSSGGDKATTTITVGQHEFPIDPWRVANLMNGAYAVGYKQCQADIRKALGGSDD